jgi:dipeptidyl aminopeptidase/acylaminoacyl peptidase
VRRGLTASGTEEKLLDEPRGFFEVESVSRDGRYLFFSEQNPKTDWDIYYMDLLGDRRVKPLLNTPYQELNARLSADDKWLAYTSTETGREELYVTPFPKSESKWQISNGGIVGQVPNFVVDWSVDGKNLRFKQGDKLYSVEVRVNGNKAEFSAPKEISTLAGDPVVLAILPDGKRILVARRVGDNTPVPVDWSSTGSTFYARTWGPARADILLYDAKKKQFYFVSFRTYLFPSPSALLFSALCWSTPGKS